MATSVKDVDARCPDIDYLSDMLEGLRSSLVLMAACDLKVFDFLDASPEPMTSQQLAVSQGWNEDNTDRLLCALVALKVLDRSTNPSGKVAYRNAGPGEYLISNKSGNLWGSMSGFGRRVASGLNKLAEEIKTGANKGASHPHQVTVHKPAGEGHDHHHGHGHDHGSERPPMSLLERYVAMDGMLRCVVDKLVTAFDLSQYQSAVDLGGGSGVASYALARAYPGMSVTVFEVPPVVQLLKEYFVPREEGVHVSIVEGDFFEKDLPKSDLYLLSKIVHDWKPEQIDVLLGRVHAAVNPGGAIVLFEKCMNDDKVGPVSANMFDMTVMSFCAGRQRSCLEYQNILEKNGFKDVQFARTNAECMYDVIYGKKQ